MFHGLFVHFPIYLSDQSVHGLYHLPQPHTFGSHVLISHSLVFPRWLFQLCHYPQNYHWAPVPENHHLEWLHDSALFGTLSWRIRGHCPHCHGLWWLCGHSQAFALQEHHATWDVPAPSGGGLYWEIVPSTVQILFTCDLTFCGPTSPEISSPCWNLPAATPTGLECWWLLTVGGMCLFIFFSCYSSTT